MRFPEEYDTFSGLIFRTKAMSLVMVFSVRTGTDLVMVLEMEIDLLMLSVAMGAATMEVTIIVVVIAIGLEIFVLPGLVTTTEILEMGGPLPLLLRVTEV